MTQLNIEISNAIDKRLSFVAQELGDTKANVINKIIENYLIELEEDIEDYKAAEEVLKQNNPTISWEEVKKRHGLED